MTRRRIRAEVEGIVQGVGFRPFVYQLAKDFQLGGFVMNTSYGALLEIEGAIEKTEGFLEKLSSAPPPLARITNLTSKEIQSENQSDFVIKTSEASERMSALISPDVAVCDDCLAEMFDPMDRRHLYPFINCTNCGPRYTIIQDIPYDREKTSMRVFPMCPECQKEYHNPLDRRFHAQPNACPVCGPVVTLTSSTGKPLDADDPIAETVRLLKKGRIVAIKGLGGYHLVVDATNESSVKLLRERKRREEKPLAVMCPDMGTIKTLADVNPGEERLLESIIRPIVLLAKKHPFPLTDATAPGNRFIGVMLPYTPLHHLIIRNFSALVMTSGNLSEEPIAIDNNEALRRLGDTADFFLMHNRDIYLRSDDSVVTVDNGRPSQIRRSRGYAPAPVFLRNKQPQILAVGGEQKNTVCLTKENRAFISQHIGDLENLQTLDFFEMTVNHLKRILDIEPECIAHDLHPDYLSGKWAMEHRELGIEGVQHHHAHIAGVMAEHGLEEPVIGIACDGTGYGEDGCIWGGEILVADLRRYQRIGRLSYTPMPGGAAAIKEPWRMAVSYLISAYGDDFDQLDLPFIKKRDPEKIRILKQMAVGGIRSPLTSSLGRLFDAVAAMAGIKEIAAFEGQPAMMLEMVHPGKIFQPYAYECENKDDAFIINVPLIIREVVGDILRNEPVEKISGRFHSTIINAFAQTAKEIALKTGIGTIALSGGCFQNRILLNGVAGKLKQLNFNVYTQQLTPVNDGGLSLGQAVIAGARIRGG